MAGVAEITEIMVDAQDGTTATDVTEFVTGIEGFQGDMEKIEQDVTSVSSVVEQMVTVGFRVGGAFSYIKNATTEAVFTEGNVLNGVPVDVPRTIKITKRPKGGAVHTYTGEFILQNNVTTSDRSDGVQRGRAQFRIANDATDVPDWATA